MLLIKCRTNKPSYFYVREIWPKSTCQTQISSSKVAHISLNLPTAAERADGSLPTFQHGRILHPATTPGHGPPGTRDFTPETCFCFKKVAIPRCGATFAMVFTGIIPRGFLFQSMVFSRNNPTDMCRTAELKCSPETLFSGFLEFEGQS